LRNKGEYSEGDRGKYNIEVKRGTNRLVKRRYILKMKIKVRIFKVCKSVHHGTIQINNQPDAKIFQFIILAFIYSSTRFGRSPAHQEELNDCNGSLWFTFVSW
jgi:hypothetical protein